MVLESNWYTPFSVNRNWHAYRNPWMRFWVRIHLEGELRFMATFWQCTCWKKRETLRSSQGCLQRSTVTAQTTGALEDSMESLRCELTYIFALMVLWKHDCFLSYCRNHTSQEQSSSIYFHKKTQALSLENSISKCTKWSWK